MLFFFGTRASNIKTKKIDGDTICPYCTSKNSFYTTIFGRYFHVFWIPFFPLSKSYILECNHCRKSYKEHELPADIKLALEKTNTQNPTKRPIWHGCGCLLLTTIIVFLFIILIAGYFFGKDAAKVAKTKQDDRRTYLRQDIARATNYPLKDNDSISYYLQACIDYLIEGVDTDEIKYYSKVNNDKLLILLKVSDMKNVEKSSRKELVYAVEDCLDDIMETNTYSTYIGVDGKWNMLMVKTPNGSDLGGKFADRNLLLPFYDLPMMVEKDSLELNK